jgi:phosphatidylserine/phosphatidylglycerophosphate/cardiolipin synthase-like enzyme
MPMWMFKTATAATPESLGARRSADTVHATPEMVGRNCHLQPYTPRDIPSIRISSDVIAYASPDSTFAVTKELFDKAKKSILIGIYDFSAPYMRQLLLDAMARKVSVTLMLDVDSADEQTLLDDLIQMGAIGVCAPSCANKSVRVFSSSHEKVIVIDGTWTLIQSGNYSVNSIPLNVVDGGTASDFKTGNRDTGLAVRSAPLARLFTEILTSDIALVDATPEMLPEQPPQDAFLIEKAPTHIPSKLFPSKRFQLTAALRVQPVVSPDNYMAVVPDLLRAATTSVLIEQQYIRASQPNIGELLAALDEARKANPRLDIRIVLGKVFAKSDLPAERANLKKLAQDHDLKLGDNIRYVNTDQLVHCHNKMVLVDGRAVLVSSQNWSDSAVTKNREAGLWVPDPDIAAYFTAIFETDWRAAFRTPEEGVTGATATPESVADGGFVQVAPGDYRDV